MVVTVAQHIPQYWQVQSRDHNQIKLEKAMWIEKHKREAAIARLLQAPCQFLPPAAHSRTSSPIPNSWHNLLRWSLSIDWGKQNDGPDFLATQHATIVCMADIYSQCKDAPGMQRNCNGFLTCALVKWILIQLEVAAVDEIAVTICCLKWDTMHS